MYSKEYEEILKVIHVNGKILQGDLVHNYYMNSLQKRKSFDTHTTL